MAKELKITFHGGAGRVTGSNFLLEHPDKRILVDCGLFQGTEDSDERNFAPFPYNPSSIDILLVTHAHADHTGLIPRLVHEGFRGKIYSTAPTKDIAHVMLLDTAKVFARNHEEDPDAPMLYEKKDVDDAAALWEAVAYHEPVTLADGLTVTLKDAGHILGSAMMEFSYGSKKLLFTGDLGNSPAPLLHDTEPIPGVDYLITESVYGNRNHESTEERSGALKDIIQKTIARGGTLMIPAFSIERTQDLLFELNNFANNKEIPNVPIFLDSPLATKVTEVYKKYKDQLNSSVQKIREKDDLIFQFPNLEITERPNESMAIAKEHGPKIIIAGSGMSSGGRIIHHEKRYLPDAKNTLLLVGYQAVGTLGRKIAEGAKSVMIGDAEVPVRAEIANIRAYSAHKDSDHILEFISTGKDSLEKVFVVLGEPEASAFLAQRINDYLGISAQVPHTGDVVTLSFD